MRFKTLLSGWILGLFALGSPTIADEMKESGEKGGTEDINIGVGELQEDKQEAQRKKTRKKAAKKKMRQKKTSPQEMKEKEVVRKDSANGTKKKKSGNVETTWKVEKGEK
jgi:hypothetical protein